MAEDALDSTLCNGFTVPESIKRSLFLRRSMMMDLRREEVMRPSAHIEFEIGEIVDALESRTELGHSDLGLGHLFCHVARFKHARSSKR